LRLHDQLEEGGESPPEQHGNYTNPSHHGALKPMNKQEEGLSSEQMRKL